jgi:transposase-like protein
MWFHAMFQMGSTKCGISAKQIQRETGVTYKTAWRMFKQVRSLMSDDDLQLEGDKAVEIDEMYHGGRRKGGKGRKLTGDGGNKTPVLGMVERGGKVVARTVKHARSAEVLPIIQKRVLPMSTIFTDESKIYDGIDHRKNPGYRHSRINHSEEIYVMGNVHTNTIEGLWSLVKRGLGGTHHMVSAKYLQEYLNEYAFRYNRRNEPTPMFRLILARVAERGE